MTSHEPDVSVVICTRGDRPELLNEALASVLDQDFRGSIETTVVLDSDGALPEVGDVRHPDRTVRVVRNEGTPGLAGARNFGLTQATAPWLATLDDDDLWWPTRLRLQLALAADVPSAPLIGSGIEIADGTGARTERRSPQAAFTHADLLRDRVAELHPSTFLMPTEAVREVGGWDESLPGSYAEDYDLMLRLTHMGDAAMVEEPLVTVRWSGNSYFFSRWRTIADALTVLLDKHPDFVTEPKGEGRILGQVAFARAAAGDRRAGTRGASAALRRNALEPRAYLALAVASGLVSADQVQSALHKRGRGI